MILFFYASVRGSKDAVRSSNFVFLSHVRTRYSYPYTVTLHTDFRRACLNGKKK